MVHWSKLGDMGTLTPAEIGRLSPQERLTLIGELWDSLADVDVPLSAAQAAELEQRFGRFDTDRVHNVTWDELKAELRLRRP
jgi:putative addiction module component (TIGR02574 family)